MVVPANTAPIANHIARRLSLPVGLGQLAGNPFRARMRGYSSQRGCPTMNQNLEPVETWRSKAGQQLLIRLPAKEINLNTVFKSLRLPTWETILLRRALRAKEGFASTSIDARLRAQRRKSFSEKLDQLRLIASRSPPLESDQPTFRGNQVQLELLRRSVQVPTKDSEWNIWRRRHPRN